ncbi:acyltransferase [Salmonella enterica]|uniref:Acyltransferase n=1 Tax=Salmonella enterica TaxID=28901 RepID=A0A5V4Z6V0_SALER|nr:acyltransferase [Salmonella enterica]EBU3912267.1 acyltransferase [Salmonella enterica]EIO1749964.1 acyltransferase [Salmonella enterica]EIU1713089.1 acyltransferase [Salmonella enterica]EJY9247946.1 acyltransferase [Salmonella enterica]
MNRNYSIDYVRGAMAMAILLYHLCSWTIGLPSPESLLGRLGIYGVSIFYVVSGVSLYISYHKKEWSLGNIVHFFAKRFFRLAPAYWIAMMIAVPVILLNSSSFTISSSTYFYNISLLFGIFEPEKYLITGGWSIGNEVVFYLIFPVMISCASRKWIFMVMYAASFYIYLYFAFIEISPDNPLGSQWYTYINPFNQLFFFTSGMMIGWFANNVSYKLTSRESSSMLVVCAALLLIFPFNGGDIGLVTQWNRVLFTVLCVGIVFFAFHVITDVKSIICRVLKFLGDISYTIYILHGAFYSLTNIYIWPRFGIDSANIKLAFYIFGFTPLLMGICYIIFNRIEMPVMRIVKNKSWGIYYGKSGA